MGVICCCVYCKQEKSSKGIHCHVDRAHLGATQYSSGYNGKYEVLSVRAKDKTDLAIKRYEDNPKTCATCKRPLPYEKRRGKFCNHGCAASHTNTTRSAAGWTPSLDHRMKVSEKLSGKVYVHPTEVKSTCTECQCEFTFIHHYTKRVKKFCSRLCAAKHSRDIRNKAARLNRPALINYRADCAFNFNLKDFPTEFDFLLVETYGWYKPKNKGNNLAGVSRDHMVSVRYGFDNDIDPTTMSHPANCRLMQHGANSAKGMSNSITYEELLERIKVWDNKY